MVTPFSDEPGDLVLDRDPALVSGLLLLTNFLDFSASLLTTGFAFAALEAAGCFCTGVLAATGVLLAVDRDGFAGVDFAILRTGLAGAAFLGAVFFGAAFVADFFATGFFDTDFATAFFGLAPPCGFFAAAGFFAAFASVLRAADTVARAIGFAGAFAFARLAGLCLIFAIPRPIL